jgi:hypothetical protein
VAFKIVLHLDKNIFREVPKSYLYCRAVKLYVFMKILNIKHEIEGEKWCTFHVKMFLSKCKTILNATYYLSAYIVFFFIRI